MQNVKKLIKKKSFLPSRGMSDISINESRDDFILTSSISASSKAEIHKYDDIQDLIVTAVTAQGLLSQCMFLISNFHSYVDIIIILLF